MEIPLLVSLIYLRLVPFRSYIPTTLLNLEQKWNKREKGNKNETILRVCWFSDTRHFLVKPGRHFERLVVCQ